MERALLVIAVLFAIGITVLLWQLPRCTRFAEVWVEPTVELDHQPDGNVSPRVRPGYWQYTCVERAP